MTKFKHDSKLWREYLKHRYYLWLAFWGFFPISGGALGDGDAWDETTPNNGTLLSDGDDHIRDVRKGVRIRMEYEHSTLAGASVGGKHKFITLQTQALKPTVDATQIAAVYAKDVGAGVIELFYEDEAGNEIQITSGSGLVIPFTAATQAEMEAASSTTVPVTPGREIYHPGVAKAWCQFNGATAGTNAPTVGHNVTSVTRNSTGNYTINLTVGFSGISFCFISSASSGSEALVSGLLTKSATAPIMETTNGAGVSQDGDIVNVVMYGDRT